MMKKLMVIILFVSFIGMVVSLILLSSKPARSATHVQCINMMQLYFLWLDQNKLKRAEKQFRVVVHSCRPLQEDEKRLLDDVIEGKRKMTLLYADITNGDYLAARKKALEQTETKTKPE